MNKILDRLRTKHGEKKWFLYLEELLCRYQDDDVSAMGAQLTYYLVLAIFPFLIFFFNILQFTPLANVNVVESLLQPLPIQAREMLSTLLAEIMNSSNVALLSFGAITTLFSASSGIMSIIKATNKAYDLDESRPYWKLRGLSVIFTLGLFIILVVALTILVFGEIIVGEIFISYTWPAVIIWKIVKMLIPLVIMALMFALLYKFAPSIKEGIEIKFKDALPGAVFASVGLIVSSLGFSFYVNNFGKYAITYGSLGGVIVFLIWIYITSIILVLGGELNATIASVKGKPINEAPEGMD